MMGRNLAEVVYLLPGVEMPDAGDGKPWLIIEAATSGLFYGSGGSYRPNGEWVGYASLAEDDVSLERALAAAERWATKYQVPTIWIQLQP
jgi:hypothetical protein